MSTFKFWFIAKQKEKKIEKKKVEGKKKKKKIRNKARKSKIKQTNKETKSKLENIYTKKIVNIFIDHRKRKSASKYFTCFEKL